MNERTSSLNIDSVSKRLVFTFFLFIGAYVEVPLGLSSGAYIPAFYLLLTVLFVAVNDRYLYKTIDYIFITTLLLFCVVSSIIAPNFDGIEFRFYAVVQMLASAVTFVVVLKSILCLPLAIRIDASVWMLRILVVLTLLEYLGVISAASDSFRSWAYSSGGYVAYSDDVRDLILGGEIRPKVFTSEPSLVAIATFVLANFSAWQSRDIKTPVEITFLLFFELLLLNSPIVILALVSILPTLFIGRSRYIYVLLIILLPLLFFIDSSIVLDKIDRFSFQELFYERGGGTVETETSERLRLIYPYISIIDVFSVNPISGLGVGGKRSLELYGSVSPNFEVSFGNNSFATVFIFFGAFGSILFFHIVYSYLKSFGIKLLPAVFVYFIFSQTMGGFESPRYWAYLAILMVPFCAAHLKSSLNFKI